MKKQWPLVELGDIFSIARGGSPRPIQKYLTDDPNGVNWIMISDASEGSKYITSTNKRIIKEGVKRSRMVKPGDFLLTNSMSFGKPYIMKTTGCIHDGWLVLSPNSSNIDVDYFYHLLGSRLVYLEFERRAAGATVKNLNISLVRSVQVPLPPLAEQQRIVAILDKADGLRAKRHAALAKLDTLLQSTFLDMFGDPYLNPKKFEKQRLEDVTLNVTDGKHGDCRPSPNSGYYFVSVKDIKDGQIDYVDARQIDPDDFLEVHQRTKLEVGDVLITNSGTIGKTAVIYQNPLVERTTFQKSVAIVKPNQRNFCAIRAKMAQKCEKQMSLKSGRGN